jgi:hypothetical protein
MGNEVNIVGLSLQVLQTLDNGGDGFNIHAATGNPEIQSTTSSSPIPTKVFAI